MGIGRYPPVADVTPPSGLETASGAVPTWVRIFALRSQPALTTDTDRLAVSEHRVSPCPVECHCRSLLGGGIGEAAKEDQG